MSIYSWFTHQKLFFFFFHSYVSLPDGNNEVKKRIWSPCGNHLPTTAWGKPDSRPPKGIGTLVDKHLRYDFTQEKVKFLDYHYIMSTLPLYYKLGLG